MLLVRILDFLETKPRMRRRIGIEREHGPVLQALTSKKRETNPYSCRRSEATELAEIVTRDSASKHLINDLRLPVISLYRK